MLKKREHMILLAVSIIVAVMILLNVVLERSNRSLQMNVAQRQTYIQQSVQLEGLYVEIIKAIAELSERAEDGDLRQVLTNQGMTVTKAMTPQTPLANETEGSKVSREIVTPGESN